MLYFVLFLSAIIISACLTKGNSRKGLLGIVASLIALPLGVIFSLTKKYK